MRLHAPLTAALAILLAAGVQVALSAPAEKETAVSKSDRTAGPAGAAPAKAPAYESPLSVDYRRLVARADLSFDHTFDISDDGLPIGNGTMGSLIWTSPHALKFQINRVDVYANGCETNSFFRRDHDYAYACGLLDIEMVDFGKEAFPKNATRQHLAVYDGLATIAGAGVTTESMAWQKGDVFAVRIDDKRRIPGTIRAKLQTMRPRAVHTYNHKAISDLMIRDGRVVLRQTFREDDYYDASAVVVAVTGRESQPRLADSSGGRRTLPFSPRSPGLAQPNETHVDLIAKAQRGAMVVWVASAATFDPNEDVVAKAQHQLDAAIARGYDGIRKDNDAWWRAFWAKGLVHMTSPDGSADEVERNCTYFLYLMACCSRGAYPPNYGGLIFSTHGDCRSWGAQHWWSNMSIYYRGLMAANHAELTRPLFDMYVKARESLERAARQHWASRGIYVPETMWFDGLKKLPDDIAAEMPELYLGSKPWDQRSQRFRTYAKGQHPHGPAWNWMAYGRTWRDGKWTIPTKSNGPFGHVTHLFSPNAELAYLAWKRYEYTGQSDWLRDKAYPLLRGAAEFYRNFPTLEKDAHGVYHISVVGNGEGLCARDTIEVVGMIRGLLPTAIRAAKMLDVDADLRAKWREMLDNFTTIPTSDEGNARLRDGYNGPAVWVTGRPPCLRHDIGAGLPSFPARLWEMDVFNVEAQHTDPATWKMAMATYRYSHPGGIAKDQPIHVLSQIPVIAAKLGQAEDFRNSALSILKCTDAENDFCVYDGTYRTGVLANRMTLREGINAIGAQRLGCVTYAVHEALCQSNPGSPGGEPVLNFFPAWPKDWNAQFTQAARGQFVVTASWSGGGPEFVEILSQAGLPCRMRNPWPGDKPLTIYRNGKSFKTVEGELLTFDTKVDTRYLLLPSGVTPQSVRRAVPAKTD